MSIKVVGIDLAKSIFQVCVWNQDGSIAWNHKITRNKLLHTIRQLPEKHSLPWKHVVPLITGLLGYWATGLLGYWTMR